MIIMIIIIIIIKIIIAVVVSCSLMLFELNLIDWSIFCFDHCSFCFSDVVFTWIVGYQFQDDRVEGGC